MECGVTRGQRGSGAAGGCRENRGSRVTGGIQGLPGDEESQSRKVDGGKSI